MIRLSERQAVTVGVYILALVMLAMALLQPALWGVELFKVLLQAVIISGFINQVLAFHFAANKHDETRAEAEVKTAETSGKMADAIVAQATAAGTPQPVQVVNAPDDPVPTQDSPASPEGPQR